MMQHLIRAIFLASFLFSTITLADKPISPAAGPCVHLRDRYRCINYPTGECFWDEADQRCESRYDYEDRCSLIRSVYECIRSQYNCFWDEDDQRCERRH